MGYSKTVLCLAMATRQHASGVGRCVAGRELNRSRVPGAWIRPVSARESEEISFQERYYGDGVTAELLDVIHIPFVEPRPRTYQTENHLIDDQCCWSKIGQGTWTDVQAALDTVDGPLWRNYSNSAYGLNDRVPEGVANTFTRSLYLVQPEGLTLVVQEEIRISGPAKRIRASFSLNGCKYRLAVTDPAVTGEYLRRDVGEFPLEDTALCISLGGVFNGYAYKLVAAVITPDMGA